MKERPIFSTIVGTMQASKLIEINMSTS